MKARRVVNNNNSQSDCNSISSDSLEIKNSTSPLASPTFSSVPFYKGEIKKKLVEHFRQNMYQKTKNDNSHTNSPHLAKSTSNDNKRNTKISNKSFSSPKNNKLIYPELHIKHCHGNKIIERTIPSTELPKHMKKPNYFYEIFQNTKDKLIIQPKIKQKSYLELYKTKYANQINVQKNYSDHSTIGDDSPHVHLSDASDEKNCNELEDNSSFYLKLTGNVKRIKSSIRYPTEVNSKVTCLTKNSTDETCVKKLPSANETIMDMKNTQKHKINRHSYGDCKREICQFGSLGPDLLSVKDKMQKFLKQKEYGQSVSNLNKFKQKKKENAEKRVKELPKDNVRISKLEIKDEDSDQNKERNQNTGRIENCISNANPAPEKIDIKQNSSKVSQKSQTKRVNDTNRTIGKMTMTNKYQKNSRKNVATLNLYDNKSNQTIDIFHKNLIKNLQERHFKEKQLVEEIRKNS